MLLVVSLLLVGSWCETTVPPIHRAAKATTRLGECSLRTGGGMEDHRAARLHFGALRRYSCVDRGLLHRLSGARGGISGDVEVASRDDALGLTG